MSRIRIITAFFLLLSLSRASAGEPTTDRYIDSLIHEAVRLKLSQTRTWHLLLHYKKTLFGYYESEQDSPAFFNSPDGKYDPEAELIATLRSFFKAAEDLGPREDHPQCDYAARYKWLKAQLSFDAERLPEQPCVRLGKWIQDLDPERITLVFAAHYMNNPASMFGHTLLRIDKKREGPEQALLDWGVNYAATADTANPLIYTLKGVFGGFKGTFSLFPYYLKVQEYSNLESRDLWEYELNFTEDQMNYLLLHLWELGGNYFDYYYFQENCSYHILSLLEVADPELYLTDQSIFHVIPADTIKAVTRYDHLVSKRVYRPSLLSQMNQKRIKMSQNQKKLLYRLAEDASRIETEEYQNLDVPEKALILDTYLDYAQYKTLQRKKTPSTIDPETRKILLERSRLDYRPINPPEHVAFSSPPELGHGSARIQVGFGRNGREFFEQVSIRPAYHDLLASDRGYGKDSQILFLETTGRYYQDTATFKLDSFRLIDIISLTPYESLFGKKSWRLSIGLDTIRDQDCQYCNSFKAGYGIGVTYKPHDFSSFLFYALADFELEASRRLDPDYRLGGGPRAGTLIDFSRAWRLHIEGFYLNFPFGHDPDYYKLSVNQRYAVTPDLDLRVQLGTLSSRKEWLLAANYYF